MIRTKFIYDKSEYVVWGEYGTDQWMCRDLWTDTTAYLTTEEINDQLAWMERTGQHITF